MQTASWPLLSTEIPEGESENKQNLTCFNRQICDILSQLLKIILTAHSVL